MLTNLRHKMVIMITYLSHWDWILYKSRKDLIKHIKSEKINAMCPDGKFTEELKNTYENVYSWNINREKILDIQAVLNLRAQLKDAETNFHCFTLKTGIIFSIASIFLKNRSKAVLSITGLGFLFSNNRRAKLMRILIKPLIRQLFSNSFKVIIFQNHADKEIFLSYSKFSNKVEIIPSSGIEIGNFEKRKENMNHQEKRKIILVSRLLYDKGILDYLNLVNRLKNENYEFYLAGERDEGNPQNINDEDMQRILLTENLNYLGEIEVERELSNFDISIIMSSHEGFSRILLESLYVGLYCLAYKIQGTEVMEDFTNLELIKLNQIDQFAELIKNFNGVADNCKNTELIEQLYSSKEVALRFEKIYQELDVLD